MKKLFQKGLALSKQSMSKGFTLIELIIVIAIIGVLAVALLAALNPVEQTNRSKDAASQVAAKALYDAINRYYTTQQVYPWCTDASTCTDITAGIAANSATWVGAGGVGAPTANTPQSKLETNGELKAGYLSGVSNASGLYVSATGGVGANSSPRVCYNPSSSQQRNIPTQIYRSVGGSAPTAAGAYNNPANSIYICVGL